LGLNQRALEEESLGESKSDSKGEWERRKEE